MNKSEHESVVVSEPWLPATGKHQATVISMSIVPLVSKPNMFMTKVALLLGEGKIYAFVTGSLNACSMLYLSEPYWINKDVPVTISHQIYSGKLTYHVRIEFGELLRHAKAESVRGNTSTSASE
jgi:hypothetical protein